MSVYLVRHCSAEGQEPEAALSETGNEQSLRLSAFLAGQGVARIVSSPFKRAVDSARPLAEILGLGIEVDPRLAKRQLGLVENGDWRAALRESFDAHKLCLPQGESSRLAQASGLRYCTTFFKERDSQPQSSLMVTCWRLLRIRWTALLVLTFGNNYQTVSYSR